METTGPGDLNSRSSLDDILDGLCDDIDAIGKTADDCLNERITAARKKNRECAEELEGIFEYLSSRCKYGRGWSAYIKSKAIRPIQRKYRKK